MRFVHTGDWQIGMRAAQAGNAAARVREERLHAARRVVDVAREHAADFLVLAGDTFEDNGVERALVREVGQTLAAAGRPVYVLPGNHDPLVPGSVWEHPVWQSAANVTVLREESAVEAPGALLFACPLRGKHGPDDPTAWIEPPPAGDGRIRIGVAHGSLEGAPADAPDFPIARNAAARAGLDYLALGHWHSTSVHEGGRVAYSGTHEVTKFGEDGGGNVLVVTIAGPGAAPEPVPVRTGGLRWLTVAESLREPDDLDRVTRLLEEVEGAATTLVRVVLTGLVAPDDAARLANLAEIAGTRFLSGRVDDEALRIARADDAWLAALPAGPVQRAVRELRDLADPSFEGERPDGVTPTAAARALLELQALSIPEVSS